MIREPRIWSHVTDELPDDHLLARVVVSCGACGVMVHYLTNECLQTWVETGRGPHCLACFARIGGDDLDDDWALR